MKAQVLNPTNTLSIDEVKQLVIILTIGFYGARYQVRETNYFNLQPLTFKMRNVNKVIKSYCLTPKNPKIPETEKITVNINSSLYREDFYKLLSSN
ncbi:MAG: hypothetical protein HC836_25955 [Richelia sp. RM2_1_2]|nr:hypothetical protein [Richelia sp. SM2_1_7]NJM18195.1 hypothetical protein [Richelia sp. SM1_7_0]NJN08477.1 hypothetical protein [Richelia sp. RM1_1_1]NJO29303.1 hypothetical protein [Richelia sp. SL_2_1]NJO61566.1 hypothetical protein [Richelia sp. RM2_1_2]